MYKVEAGKAWVVQPVKVKFPAGTTSEDFKYWSDRASEIEGCPIILSPTANEHPLGPVDIGSEPPDDISQYLPE